MDREQSLLLTLLSDYLRGDKTSLVSDVNWGRLASWSEMHQVDGVVFYQCRGFMPDKVKTAFEKRFNATLFSYKNRERVLKNIKKECEFKGVPILTVKGIDVADCYPLPALRTMGDIDLLVHKEDKEVVGQILESLGFSIVERNPDLDWNCDYKGMQFELHHNLFYYEAMTTPAQADFFNDYWNYVKDGQLDWSFHFLFLLAHLRKHLANKGIGFRMFMDLAAVMLAKGNAELDWGWIEEKLKELSMEEFGAVCLALIDKWFDVKNPIGKTTINEDFLSEATQTVFANGIFGQDNIRNESNTSINNLMEKSGENKSIGGFRLLSRWKLFIKVLFPSYRNMVNSPYYHFVRGRKWLLPVGWMYRIIRMAMGKTNSAGSIMKRIMTPNDVINERKVELRKWGLIETSSPKNQAGNRI